MAGMPDRAEKMAALKSQIETLLIEQKRLVPLALNAEYPKDEDAAMALGYVQLRLSELSNDLFKLEREAK